MLRVKNQGRTKDEPRNDLRTPKHKKCCLLRLTSLLLLLYLAWFYRENSERRPKELRLISLRTKVLFIKISFQKKLSPFLKQLTHFLQKLTKKSLFSCSIQNNSLPLQRIFEHKELWQRKVTSS